MSSVNGHLEILAIGDITPSPYNQREFTKKPTEALAELADNIKANGVINPLTARPFGDAYQLVAGERRWRAAELAGLTEVPVYVRELTDVEATDIIVSENLFREDLHPLEEARQVQLLLEQHENDAREAADVIGKPLSWVVRRARLTNLSKAWLTSLKKDAEFRNWSASKLEVIARLPHNQQDEILKGANLWSGSTVKDLERTVGDRLRILSKAPWELDDATLIVKAGACADCPKRTDVTPGLFDDSDDPKEGAKCIDVECWEAKTRIVIMNERARIEKKDGDVPVLIRTNWNTKMEGSEHEGGFQKAKKSDKGAVKVLFVDGARAGRTGYMKPWSSGARIPGAGSGAKKKTLKEKRSRLKERRLAEAMDVFAEFLEQDIDVGAVSLEHQAALVALDKFSSGSLRKGFEGTPDDEVAELFYKEVTKDVLVDLIRMGDVKTRVSDAELIAELTGFDLKAAIVQATEKYPEPKSWSKAPKSQ